MSSENKQTYKFPLTFSTEGTNELDLNPTGGSGPVFSKMISLKIGHISELIYVLLS